MAGEPLLNRSVLGLLVATEQTGDEQDKVAALIAEKLGSAIDRPVCHFRTRPNEPWLSDVPNHIATLKSRSLLLFGGLLEGAVTQIALTALLDGFDVFLAADGTRTNEPAYRETFLLRIHACGGTIITIRQAIRELMAIEASHRDCADLAKLLDELGSGGAARILT